MLKDKIYTESVNQTALAPKWRNVGFEKSGKAYYGLLRDSKEECEQAMRGQLEAIKAPPREGTRWGIAFGTKDNLMPASEYSWHMQIPATA